MIEFAHVPDSGDTYMEAAVRRAPAWARDAVNRARHRAGLREIKADPSPRAIGPGVYWDPTSPHRPRGGGLAVTPRGVGRGPVVDRVLLVVAHGDALAKAVRRSMPETIARGAFGPADTLNRERGWGIVAPGHEGSFVAFGGRPDLRAHDTDVGLVLVWEPNASRADHAAAVRMVEDGARCSVLMQVMDRRTLPGPIDMVTRARLVNVALTHRPAYGGSVTMLFRRVYRDDPDAFREQLAAVAGRARWYDRHSRGLVC